MQLLTRKVRRWIRLRRADWREWLFAYRVARINRRKSKLPPPALGITHEQHYYRDIPSTDTKLITYARKVTYRRKPRLPHE